VNHSGKDLTEGTPAPGSKLAVGESLKMSGGGPISQVFKF
jgi:hypothetical protein